MKNRFTTVDIVASLSEIQKYYGFRVNNVYNIDNKSYLLKLSNKEAKVVILFESGTRLHTTEFEWPKNQTPSGFTMKLRKHIHNRRLESAKQLGVDRIIDFQFGTGVAAYHVIQELYDKGNIILTDHEYMILNVLRPRTENEDVKFVVRNTYPIGNAIQNQEPNTPERLREIIMGANVGDNLRRVLNPHMVYGPSVIDHVLIGAGFRENAKIGNGFNVSEDISKLLSALDEANRLMDETKLGNIKGYIIQKKEKKVVDGKQDGEFLTYDEFHPHLYRQHLNRPYVEFESFNKAVDEFFSKIETQKIDLKQIQQEKEALKKLENVKKDHEKRLTELEQKQDEDKIKAQLIEMNLDLVDRAIVIVQSAIAEQINWKEIWALIQEAKLQGDPVASAIKTLKLDINHMTMLLSDPFTNPEDVTIKPCLVEINLDQSAYSNAKRYYDMKRHAAKKEQKTIESSTKAYKSAEKKTKQTLKEAAVVANIKKARKVLWFEKFYWFISSENYLAIGGRDQQQNEMIVKRYLRPGDIYVHADLHGASSIVIKNPSGLPVPPKTLNEVGTMAVCFSSAWDAKVVTSAWWVHHDQVSKTAPSGEYLTTGSFMIRGKKNFLPPCYLVMGFGLLFRLGEESIAKHKGERQLRTLTDEINSIKEEVEEDHLDVPLDESDDDEDKPSESASVTNPPPSEDAVDTDTDEGTNEENAFPDTVIELEHVEGEQFRMKHRTVSIHSNVSETTNDNETVVYLGDDKPVVVKQQVEKKITFTFPQIPKKPPQPSVKPPPIAAKVEKPQQLKRGQKYKLKKMEKYKDQDEEDRILAMKLLQGPDGPNKKPKLKKGKKGKGSAIKGGNVGGKVLNSKPSGPKSPFITDPTKSVDSSTTVETGSEPVSTNGDKSKEVTQEDSDDEQQDDTKASLEDALILDTLTGIPDAEDILLYSIPVCAPYNSLTNYKYKVKLVPGTGKRGKAVKTAIAMFQHDKTATPREKDLVRSLKDQDASRNIPGKVKMSAPQLQKVKKR